MSFFTWFFLGSLEFLINTVFRLGILGVILIALFLWICFGSIGGSYWMMVTGK